MQGIRRFALDAQRPYHALLLHLKSGSTANITRAANKTPRSQFHQFPKIHRAALRAKSAIMCSRSMVDTVLTLAVRNPCR